MTMLTRLVLLLAVLALLPFGSFAAKFGTVPHVAAAVVSAKFDDAAVAPVATQKTFATVKSRCKGTALPGSPCNPALAVWPDELTLAFHAPATLLQAGAWWARPGQTPAQPRDPPKLA